MGLGGLVRALRELGVDQAKISCKAVVSGQVHGMHLLMCSKALWRVTFLYMNCDMTISSILLSWLLSVLWRKCTVYVGAHQNLLHVNAGFC